jgi:hypothetical protein
MLEEGYRLRFLRSKFGYTDTMSHLATASNAPEMPVVRRHNRMHVAFIEADGSNFELLDRLLNQWLDLNDGVTLEVVSMIPTATESDGDAYSRMHISYRLFEGCSPYQCCSPLRSAEITYRYQEARNSFSNT